MYHCVWWLSLHLISGLADDLLTLTLTLSSFAVITWLCTRSLTSLLYYIVFTFTWFYFIPSLSPEFSYRTSLPFLLCTQILICDVCLFHWLQWLSLCFETYCDRPRFETDIMLLFYSSPTANYLLCHISWTEFYFRQMILAVAQLFAFLANFHPGHCFLKFLWHLVSGHYYVLFYSLQLWKPKIIT